VYGIDFGSQKLVVAAATKEIGYMPRIISNNLSNHSTPYVLPFDCSWVTAPGRSSRSMISTVMWVKRHRVMYAYHVLAKPDRFRLSPTPPIPFLPCAASSLGRMPTFRRTSGAAGSVFVSSLLMRAISSTKTQAGPSGEVLFRVNYVSDTAGSVTAFTSNSG
jgi:hypothetical protein